MKRAIGLTLLFACRPTPAPEGPEGVGARVADAPATTLTDLTGHSFAQSLGAADVNGDGYADLVVGAPTASGSKGAVFVYVGSPGGVGERVATTVTGASGDGLGSPVAGIGDVDDDGYDDVVLIPVDTSGGGLYRGSSSGLSTKAFGKLPEDLEATSIAAGDVNADGLRDLVVGQGRSGLVSVFLGGDSGVDMTPASVLSGPSGGDRFGASVDLADVNGDGAADLIVGAPLRDGEEGAVYVYLGGASGLATTATRLTPPTARSRFGDAVANAGDVDGDGDDDVIVGTNPGNRGEAFLFTGSPDGLATAPATSLSGAAEGALFGEVVDGAGDVNADGFADVVVSARGVDGRTGAVYVFEGSATGLHTTPATTLSGGAAAGNFGTQVLGAGDVNGDGYDDIAVTDRDESTGDGRVFVFQGYEVADRDGDGVFMPTDCDDTDDTIGGPSLAYLDEDGDGYGVTAATVCPGRPGYAALGGDCDDDENDVNPGALETCDKNDVDQDCDGLVEDADPSLSVSSTATWYADADGDGFGDLGGTKAACDPPEGYVSNTQDCDDDAYGTYPGAAEVAGDGVDQDCDGADLPGDGGGGGGGGGCATGSGAAGALAVALAFAVTRRRRAATDGGA